LDRACSPLFEVTIRVVHTQPQLAEGHMERLEWLGLQESEGHLLAACKALLQECYRPPSPQPSPLEGEGVGAKVGKVGAKVGKVGAKVGKVGALTRRDRITP